MIRQILGEVFRAATRAGVRRRRTMAMLTVVLTGCFVLVGLRCGEKDPVFHETCRDIRPPAAYPIFTAMNHPHH